MRESKKQMLEGVTDYKSARLIGNNTLEIVYNNGLKAIRLHHTDIISYTTDNCIILNSGGWHSHTTKSRMNDFIGPDKDIMQRNFNWYVKTPAGVFDYFDGMKIDAAGNVLN